MNDATATRTAQDPPPMPTRRTPPAGLAPAPDGAPPPKREPVTLELREVIVRRDQRGDEVDRIERITLRPVRAGDMRGLPADPARFMMDHFLDMAAKLANQPPHVIDALAPEDLQEVIEVVGFFMGSFRGT